MTAAAPLAAVESLNVSFLAPDGGVSVKSYSGIVRVTVSGTGQAQARHLNDAFYLYDPLPISHDAHYDQLTFSTAAITGTGRMLGAVRDIVGGLPAYEANHVYTFLLDTKATAPTQLHFGVSDGVYTDNSGAFDITLAVPEPASWALMLAGFAGVGLALRRRPGSIVVAA